MAKKAPVHVLPREDGWAVVREGNDRATSVHPTQAEAAKVGREIARKNGAEFLLHAKDGHVRDHRDYAEDAGQPEEAPLSPAAGVVNAATQATGDAVGGASGIIGETLDHLGRAEQGAPRGGETSGKGTGDTEEAGDLAYEERYAEYEVHDQSGERLGKVDTIFLDEDERLEYVGVKAGFLGTRSTLIPIQMARIDDERQAIEVAADKERIENGPAFDDYEEITPELEREVYGYYGLEQTPRTGGRGTYSDYYSGDQETSATTGTTEPGMVVDDTVSSDSRKRESEGLLPRESTLEAEDDIRVQRSEEELRVGTRSREAGALRVRKRVHTDRERIEVPKKRTEVTVERVPVEEGAAPTGEEAATAPEIREDEIVVPVVEEEIVVEKRPVVKEEIRIRKEVVEEVEVIEEDVRREEIDVEDQSNRSDT